MSLPSSYTLKPGSLRAFFDAILNAQAPDRFSYKFLEALEFKASNDRLMVGILKDLGFLDTDGKPQQRYFEYLDRSLSQLVLAEAVRDAYSDLFTINKDAHKLTVEEVTNKLRTLFAGAKKDSIIKLIARTFTGLCELADFGTPRHKGEKKPEAKSAEQSPAVSEPSPAAERDAKGAMGGDRAASISLDSLQYHINIVLPETRDQGVYDAIFKSLRQHLG